MLKVYRSYGGHTDITIIIDYRMDYSIIDVIIKMRMYSNRKTLPLSCILEYHQVTNSIDTKFMIRTVYIILFGNYYLIVYL